MHPSALSRQDCSQTFLGAIAYTRGTEFHSGCETRFPLLTKTFIRVSDSFRGIFSTGTEMFLKKCNIFLHSLFLLSVPSTLSYLIASELVAVFEINLTVIGLRDI